jgi:hypothetical protein
VDIFVDNLARDRRNGGNPTFSAFCTKIGQILYPIVFIGIFIGNAMTGR